LQQPRDDANLKQPDLNRSSLMRDVLREAFQQAAVPDLAPLTFERIGRENHVFDCGTIPSGAELELPADEFRGHRWVAPEDLRDLVAPYTEWRVNVALDAGEGGPVRYLVGHPESRAAA
jgi:hypothetical protein